MSENQTSIALLGGGCFWCLEAVYQEIRGVNKVESGYAGGANPDPSYEQICTGTTGHAEVVRIHFDTQLISYRDLLQIFFAIHDPTTRNRQGNDSGTQYRSVIFYYDEEQATIARAIMHEMLPLWRAPLVTQLQPVPVFYLAEAYHQNYFRQHPEQGYCALVVAPKLVKARAGFAKWMR